MENLTENLYQQYQKIFKAIKWEKLTENHHESWYELISFIQRQERENSLNLLLKELNRQGINSDGVTITLKSILDIDVKEIKEPTNNDIILFMKKNPSYSYYNAREYLRNKLDFT